MYKIITGSMSLQSILTVTQPLSWQGPAGVQHTLSPDPALEDKKAAGAWEGWKLLQGGC